MVAAIMERMLQLVLASSSPRRAELLRAAKIDFQVRAAAVDESRLPGECGSDYVLRLASLKASSVARNPGEVILGADTTVVRGNEILEKPRDAGDAARMLRLLSGCVHQVITGVCLRGPDGDELTMAETTAVEFLTMSEAEIQDYIATGEPMDKAGAYGIQGIASRYISRVEGCYFNVVGLPVSLVWRMLERIKSSRADRGL